MGTAGSSWRALAIMSASIASYFVKFAFPEGNETGFYLIFVPQLVGALIMCGICFYKFRSRAAGIQLGCFIVVRLHPPFLSATIHPSTTRHEFIAICMVFSLSCYVFSHSCDSGGSTFVELTAAAGSV